MKKKRNNKKTFVGDKIKSEQSNWKFSKSVAKVFDTMFQKVYHYIMSRIRLS